MRLFQWEWDALPEGLRAQLKFYKIQGPRPPGEVDQKKLMFRVVDHLAVLQQHCYEEAGDACWRSFDGTVKLVSNMSNGHLVNSLKRVARCPDEYWNAKAIPFMLVEARRRRIKLPIYVWEMEEKIIGQ